MTLGLAGLIPFVRTGLVRFISGKIVVFTVGWEAGLMENPIPLAILSTSHGVKKLIILHVPLANGRDDQQKWVNSKLNC
jgi:hypothetical protein